MRRHQLVLDCIKRAPPYEYQTDPAGDDPVATVSIQSKARENRFTFNLTRTLHGVKSMRVTEYAIQNVLNNFSSGSADLPEDPYFVIQIDPSVGGQKFEDGAVVPAENYQEPGTNIEMRRTQFVLPVREKWSQPPEHIEVVRSKDNEGLSIDHLTITFERPKVRSTASTIRENGPWGWLGEPATPDERVFPEPEFERAIIILDVLTDSERPLDTPFLRASVPHINDALSNVTPHAGISNVMDTVDWGRAIHYKHP